MITQKDVFKEIKSPQEIEKMTEAPILLLIYKAIYMIIRLLLNIRTNQVKVAKYFNINLSDNYELKNKSKITVNTVIKDSDNIKA